MLTIALLGVPIVTQAGQPLRLSRPLSQALLYFLAAHPAPVRRDQLIAHFWPEHERAHAQHLLRSALYRLRQVLGATLQVDGEQISLAADTQVDLRRFSAALGVNTDDPSTLAVALAGYRDDFLAGFTLVTTPQFDEWVARQRIYYQRQAINGWARLSRIAAQRGDWPAAITSIERALALDPLREELQREALQLYYLAGDRARAIRHYEHLRALLDREFGVPPMAETQALYDAIVTDRLSYEPGVPVARPASTKMDHLTPRAITGSDDDHSLILYNGVRQPSAPIAAYAVHAGQQAARRAAWADAIIWYQLALPPLDAAQRLAVQLQLGLAQLHAGLLAEASTNFEFAGQLAAETGDTMAAAEAAIGLLGTLLPQGRYTEALAVAPRMQSPQRVEQHVAAAFFQGLALAIAGADLAGAERQFADASRLLERERATAASLLQVQIAFERGNVLAEQGNVPAAVASYRDTLAVAASAWHPDLLHWHILALNNLAYHRHLLGEAGAADDAYAGLELATAHGVRGALPFLHSTLGELALDQGELARAERHGRIALELATALGLRERIAGATALLGRLLLQRDQPEAAYAALAQALDIAEALRIPHLAATIRLWLVPLLPGIQTHAMATSVATFAAQTGRTRLHAESIRLLATLPHA